VLIQHNIVTPVPIGPPAKAAASHPRPARGAGRFVYEACLDEVLARHWYWWVVGMAERRFAADGGLLMEHMLAVGRSTLEDLAQGAALAACKGRPGLSVADKTETLSDTLQLMREARFLDAVDELPAEDDTGAGGIAMAPVRHAPAGRGSRCKRGRGAVAVAAVSSASVGKRKRTGPVGSPSVEIDARALVVVAATASSSADGRYRRLWRANLAEARRAFRWDAISTLVTDKHDEMAGMVRLLLLFSFACHALFGAAITDQHDAAAGMLCSASPAPNLTRRHCAFCDLVLCCSVLGLVALQPRHPHALRLVCYETPRLPRMTQAKAESPRPGLTSSGPTCASAEFCNG
jgi:hypothetical protein